MHKNKRDGITVLQAGPCAVDDISWKENHIVMITLSLMFVTNGHNG